MKYWLLLLLLLPLEAWAQTDSLETANQDPVADFFETEGISLDSCRNYALYDEVCGWIEVPYKYAHCSKNGTDCSGLAKHLYRSIYSLELKGGSKHIWKRCQPVKQENLMEGDLVFFKIYNDNISHIGVYLGNNKFVHASTKRGVIVSDLREEYYATRFFSGGRIVLKTEQIATETQPTATDTLPTGQVLPK